MFDESEKLQNADPTSMSLDQDLNANASESVWVTQRNKIAAGVGLLVGLLAVLAFALGWFSPSTGGGAANRGGPPPAPVAIAEATTMTMAPHSMLPGTVVSLRDAVIASEASGKVLSVALVGDVVAEGDSLAEIDPQNAQQLVAERTAELQRLQSLHSYHSDYFQRVGAEQNDLGIPEVTIAELRSNVETSKAEVARAKAALTSAQNDLARTSISAPFAGRVVSQSIQAGEFSQVGSPVARLVDTQNLEISARVPAALVQPLEAGTMLTITGMGREIQAPLRALVPVGDSISRTMELRVSLENSDLLVGSPVRVSLPTAIPKEVVAIPRDAVILRPQQQYVFVINDGVAERRDVELGYGEGDMIEVLGNIAAGEQVIIRGGERLRDGQTVFVQGSAPTADETPES